MRSDAGKGAALERRNARKVLVCEISIASGTMVFVTAPAQPSRNACRICSPEAVGGPEASRNGFLSVSGPTVVSRERSGVGIWSFLELELCWNTIWFLLPGLVTRGTLSPSPYPAGYSSFVHQTSSIVSPVPVWSAYASGVVPSSIQTVSIMWSPEIR